ncbi:MAG: hypothetical protein ACXVCV_07930, partial [Polyangia bacterium]
MTGKIHLRRSSSSPKPLAPPPIPPLRAVPPPLPPVLKSVPPPPTPPILHVAPRPRPDVLDEDPTTNDYRGALVPQSTMVRMFGETRAMVVKLFERMRTIQQLRSAVAIQRATPRSFGAAQVNKLVVSTYKLVGFAVLTLIALAL